MLNSSSFLRTAVVRIFFSYQVNFEQILPVILNLPVCFLFCYSQQYRNNVSSINHETAINMATASPIVYPKAVLHHAGSSCRAGCLY